MDSESISDHCIISYLQIPYEDRVNRWYSISNYAAHHYNAWACVCGLQTKKVDWVLEGDSAHGFEIVSA